MILKQLVIDHNTGFTSKMTKRKLTGMTTFKNRCVIMKAKDRISKSTTCFLCYHKTLYFPSDTFTKSAPPNNQLHANHFPHQFKTQNSVDTFLLVLPINVLNPNILPSKTLFILHQLLKLIHINHAEVQGSYWIKTIFITPRSSAQNISYMISKMV